MARVTVYVPDTLKGLMDPLGDRVNWSNVAQTAFQAEVQRYFFLKEINMQSVIERLRSSKEQYEAGQFEAGKSYGTKWAMENASYDQLKRLSSFDLEEGYADNLVGAFEKHMNNDFSYRNLEDGFWATEDGYQPPSDEYLRGFVEGAQTIWEEVEDQL